MIFNTDSLRKETVALIRRIDAQIAVVAVEAAQRDIPIEELQDDRGNWVMPPLLLAKATAYNTLVALQPPKK